MPRSKPSLAVLAGLVTLLMRPSPVAAATGDSFSFIIIADPHIRWSHCAENTRRLQRCVDWINVNHRSADVELVFVLGDVGWESNDGRLNVRTAKEVLDGLTVPYVPVIGDDDILFGRCGLDFIETFEPVHQSLADLASDPGSGFANWRRGPTKVLSPYRPAYYDYFLNFAFEYRGVQFICLDFCSRDGSRTIFKTQDDDTDLHDHEGGTWPWFTRCLAECPKDKKENIVLMSHNPLVTLRTWGILKTVADGLTLDNAEFDKLSAFLNDPNYNYADHVHAAYAGHVHFQAYLPEDADSSRVELPGWLYSHVSPRTLLSALPRLPGYDLYAIQASHYPAPAYGPETHPRDEVRMEQVTVTEGQTGFTYVSESILVPTLLARR